MFDANGSQQEDVLLHFLMQIDHNREVESSKSGSFDDDEHVALFGGVDLLGLVKREPDSDVSLYELFDNAALLESYRRPVGD